MNNKFDPEMLALNNPSNEDLEAVKGTIIERSVMADPKWVGAAAGLLGGLYVTGLTGRSTGKLLGTAVGVAAGYFAGVKIDESLKSYSKEDDFNKALISGSVGAMAGMFGAGIGGVFDTKAE